MPESNWIVEKTCDGWMVLDENSDDRAAFAVCKGQGAEALANRIAAALNA